MKQESLKKLGSLIWLVLVWVNLNSLKVISFKGRFPWCMRNVISVRQKNVIYSQPFLKMRTFLLDMRKGFLMMNNFYLVEILSESNSLTTVTSKKMLKMSSYALILSIFFLKMRIRKLQCNLTPYTKLPAYIRTSCWSAKSILMAVRHYFVYFIQIERYKANGDAKSQFCHFVSNIS